MDRPWIIATVRSLDISKFLDVLHLFLEKYCEWLPWFNGINGIIVENHMHELY